MNRIAAFINCYHIDTLVSEPVMNVFTMAVMFSMKLNGF